MFSYDGTIRWNRVYRQFYDLPSISTRLNSYIPRNSRILFSGFADVAHQLTSEHYVHLVEFSKAMAKAAQQECTGISEITRADVLEKLPDSSETVVFIVCRISAYWHTNTSMLKLLEGFKYSQKNLLIVDFFDANRLHSTRALGDVTFSSVTRNPVSSVRSGSEKMPNVTTAIVSGRYIGVDFDHSFEERRAFYDPEEVSRYVRAELKDFQVAIESPLIRNDPSFTLVVRRPSN